jgi:uncharacterized protein YuzE
MVVEFWEEPQDPKKARTRIEIVADVLCFEARVDFDADMAYIDVIPHESVSRTSLEYEEEGLLVDYDDHEKMIGIEVFLVNGTVSPAAIKTLKRLLT